MRFNKLFLKNNILASLVLGTIVSACLVLGYQMNHVGTVFQGGFISVLTFVLIALALTAFSCIFTTFLDKKAVDTGASNEKRSEGAVTGGIEPTTKKLFLKRIVRIIIFSLIILILWFPSFLAVYPGWFNYDAPWQLSMYIDGKITSHHPVLHTLILGKIIEGVHQIMVARGDYSYNYNLSIAIYCLFQMLLSSVGLGYITEFVRGTFARKVDNINQRKNRMTWIIQYIPVILTMLFFGMFPPIVLLVMSPTKDIFFGVCLAVFCIKTYHFFEKEGDGKQILDIIVWAIMLLLCIIFRQNSIYCFALLLIPFGILLWKKRGRKFFTEIFIAVIVVIITYVIYTGPGYKALSVQPGSKAEMLSVPCQQIAKVYVDHGDELSADQLELIRSIFNTEDFLEYREKLADPIKGALIYDSYIAHKSDAIKLYFDLSKKYPKEYIDVFISLNYGFWYPDAVLDLYEDGKTLFFAANHILPSQSASKLPAMLEYYKSFESGFPVQGGGLLTWLLMPAMFAYVMLFSAIYGIKKKNVGSSVVAVLLLLVWLTFLLGPCVSIRYVFFLYIGCPIIICLIERTR